MVQPIAVGKKSQNYAKHIGHRANSHRVRAKHLRHSLARDPFLASVRCAAPALASYPSKPSGYMHRGKRPCRLSARVSNGLRSCVHLVDEVTDADELAEGLKNEASGVKKAKEAREASVSKDVRSRRLTRNLNDCVSATRHEFTIHAVMQFAEQCIRDELRQHALADLAQRARINKPVRERRQIVRWHDEKLATSKRA